MTPSVHTDHRGSVLQVTPVILTYKEGPNIGSVAESILALRRPALRSTSKRKCP